MNNELLNIASIIYAVNAASRRLLNDIEYKRLKLLMKSTTFLQIYIYNVLFVWYNSTA